MRELKRTEWPFLPFIPASLPSYRMGESRVIVIAFAITPGGRYSKRYFHATTAYQKQGESPGEATLRAVRHWHNTQRSAKLRSGYTWGPLGIYSDSLEKGRNR